MIIEIGTIRSTVTQATDAEHSWLSEHLAFPEDKVFVRKAMGFEVKGDGYTYLYDRADDTFPAGFTRSVVKAAKLHGIAVALKDARVVPAAPLNPPPDLSWLRDYQAEGVATCVKRVRGLVWAATGGGKTEIAVALVESVPVPWLFLVHREQLTRQAAERYHRRTGLTAGTLDAPSTGHGLTVVTFQGLWAALKRNDKRVLAWLQTIGGIIVDECHTVPADTFRAALNRCPAYYRIGLSGTPLARGDRKSMHIIGCLGPVIYRISAKMLIDAGVLAKPIIRMVRHEEVYEDAKASYDKVYKELLLRSKPRNLLVLSLAMQAPRPTLIFVRLGKHGEALTKALTKRGVQVEYVSGNAATKVREAAVRRLERGDTDIVVSTVVMNEGVDIPELRSVIMAAGGASTIEALQRVGRGMRVVPGKTTFEVWDIWDQGHKFTERHAKERKRAYEVEEYEVEIIDPPIPTPPTITPAR